MHNPKHILITGASSGLGAALALRYATPGVWLALHGRHEGRLNQVAARAIERGAIVSQETGDVTNAEAMATWIKRCDAQRELDLVIANAGISLGSDQNYDTPVQSAPVFATNLQGLLNTVQPALPYMVGRGRGQLALMSSLASFRGFAGAASYCSSKAAVRVYGEALRAETAAFGVNVNVICPGFIKTPLTDKNRFSMPFLMTPEEAATIIQKGLLQNEPRIAFPWPMHALVRIAALLPQDLVNRAMAQSPKKGRPTANLPKHHDPSITRHH